MSQTITWNGTTYSIPSATERNWASLSNFLIALGTNAAIKSEMFQAVRTATTTPVTVSNTTDFTVITELAAPGAVDVTLPVGADGQMFLFVDGTGDAGSNNITITPNGSETILGAATLVLNKNKQSVMIQYDATNTDWRVLFNVRYPDNISLTAEVTGILPVANGGTNSSSALSNNRVMKSSSGTIIEAAAITANRVLVSDANGIPVAATPTTTEVNYVSGVTSAIQDQINSKEATVSLTASKAVASTAGGALVASTTTSTELGYVSGVTSAIQTQMDLKAPLASPTLTTPTLTTPIVNAGALSGTFSGDHTVSGEVTYSGTGANSYQSGTTAQRPGSPVNGMFRYNSDAAQFEGYAGSAWGAIGGSSSGVNYITDSDAESGVGDWVTYADAAGATPVNGVDGSPTVTWTSQTGTVLRGSKSFKLLVDAANRQGEGASFPFTLDAADKSKMLKISFDFDASDANYVASDVGIYIYDITNTTLISPSQVNIPGGSGKWEATFSATTSTSYRLIAHVQSTATSGYSLYFDNFLVGPETAFVAAPVGDWESYTPTTNGLGTISSVRLQFQRVGESIFIRGEFTTGTVSASEARLGLPAGLTIGGTATGTIMVGEAERDAAATSLTVQGLLATVGDTYLNYGRDIETTSANPMTPLNGNDLFGSSERQSIDAGPFPIAEWAGSGVSLASARVEYASAEGVSGWDSDAAVGDSVYGSAGSSIGGALTGSRTKSVRFQTPIQESDIVELQIESLGNGTWIAASDSVPFVGWPSVNFGARVNTLAAVTDVGVTFFDKARPGTTYNSATGAQAWNSVLGTSSRWRFKKSSPNAPAGIQLATATVPGLTTGLKEYEESVTTGLTLSGTGWTTGDARFIPYQTTDGSWRMKFSIRGTWTSAASIAIGITGISAPKAAFSSYPESVAAYTYGVITGITTFTIFYGAAQTGGGCAGDIKLNSKPTWAD